MQSDTFRERRSAMEQISVLDRCLYWIMDVIGNSRIPIWQGRNSGRDLGIGWESEVEPTTQRLPLFSALPKKEEGERIECLPWGKRVKPNRSLLWRRSAADSPPEPSLTYRSKRRVIPVFVILRVAVRRCYIT